MATKKTLQLTAAKDAETKKRRHIECSKLCLWCVLLLVCAFLVFVCYEVHLTGDLSAIGYIAAGVLVCLGLVVKAYMKRAYQKDLVELELEKTKRLTALKKKYGEDFVYERIDDIDLSA